MDEFSSNHKDTENQNPIDSNSDLKAEKAERSAETDTVTKIYAPVHDPEHKIIDDQKKRNKAKKKQRRFAILTSFLVVLVVICIIVATAAGVIFVKMIDDSPVINVSDFVGQESTKIYDDEGTLVTEIGTYLRENITYDKCPESLVDAFLSIEDSRYFEHFGFDIPRFTKAILENLKNRDFSQGGSTFTMQLVKMTYFQDDTTGTTANKSIDYKVQQIYLAIELETQLDKKEIFQLYMNKLNFGGNVRGVQKASIYYFGKDSTDLSLSESALLAGLINMPNTYNPYSYLDYATDRRNQVLDSMVYHGYITQNECDLAKAIKVEDQLVGENRSAAEGSQYQSYIDTVVSEAQKMTGKDPTVYGMEIHTYMNRTVQDTIDSIQNGEPTVQFPDELMQVAMISMNNQTGAIIGIGGGRNYDGARLLNRATSQYKQPGSSVKPILSYALAFEYLGYSMDEILIDKPITYPMESRVLVNFSGQYEGDITIKDAVGKSLNIPAILTLEKVVDKIGSNKVVDYLQSIGYTRVTDDNFHLSYAIGGTTFETTVYEMAGAHAMIINDGVYNEPHTIEKIEMTDGSEYYPQNQNRQVLSSGSAYLTAMLMENNVSGPYFNYMQILKRDYPVYAKTGTTDWGSDGLQYGIPKGVAKDKWMISSTSQYTNAVWIGYDMAQSGEQTYFTSYKSSLNIPGNINKLLLDSEDTISDTNPTGVEKPDDVVDSTYVYGTYPHVTAEDWMDSSTIITSQVSAAGLKNQPLISSSEHLETEAPVLNGITAVIGNDGFLTVSWDTNSNTCTDGKRNISLHDDYNNIDMWGACLADLTWLTSGNGNTFWATVYNDDYEVAQITSDSGYYHDWPADMWGTVKVCGGFSNEKGTSETVCTVATYELAPAE